MSSVIKYGSETIATADNDTKTLLTAGKILENDISVSDSTPLLQSFVSRRYTPSTQQQSDLIRPDDGYAAMKKVPVTVDAIPSEYIIPTGSLSITANGSAIDVAQYATADVAVPTVLKKAAIRPDAEVVKTFSYDKLLISDGVLTSLPAYSTSATTFKAAATISETYTLDYANYDYLIAVRCLTIPIYSVTSKAKGRAEYHVTGATYEIAEIPADTFTALVDSTKVTSRSVGTIAQTAFSRLVYWSSGSAISAYSTTAYGVCQAITAPSLSSGVVTFTSPLVTARGSSTYFTSTYWGYMTDVRVQYVQEVYRVAKGSLNMDGFNTRSNTFHTLSCLNSRDHKLT